MEPPSNVKSRRRIGAVAGAAAVVVSVCVVISVVSFAVWREWPWSSYPSQLHYCGRDYLGPGVANSPSEVKARGAHTWVPQFGAVFDDVRSRMCWSQRFDWAEAPIRLDTRIWLHALLSRSERLVC